MYRLAVLAFLFAGASFAASPIIIGVRGGVPLNDIVNAVDQGSTVGGTFESATQNYVVGPTLGVRLPAGFSITGDALFTRLKINANRTGGSISANANSWEFPVMLRWSLHEAPISPVIGAGVSVRHLRDFSDVGRFITGNNDNPLFPDNNTVGFVIGGGVQFKAGPVYITPEIRYTRWNVDNAREGFRNFFEVNRNQAQILVGVTF